MKKTVLIIGIVVVLSSSITHALSERLLYCITTGVGAGVWLSATLCINKSVIAHLVGTSLGVTTGLASYLTFYGITDEGKLERAAKKIEEVMHNPIAGRSNEDQHSYLELINDYYITSDLWLVVAYNDLVELAHEMNYAINLLNGLLESSSANNRVLAKSRVVLDRAYSARRNIVGAIKEIRSNNEYPVQLMMQKKSALHHKRLMR